jgi:hypothetical protein
LPTSTTKKTLVISTVDGFALSAAKQLGLANEIFLLDTHTAAEAMLAAGFIADGHARRLPKSQFRSFDFTPHAGAFLLSGHTLPSTPLPRLKKYLICLQQYGSSTTSVIARQPLPERPLMRQQNLQLVSAHYLS